MRRLVKVAAVVMVSVFVSTTAYAQATIAGTVKDLSGGVLPGVTVEASSPALTWLDSEVERLTTFHRRRALAG